ncbi:hypothetical protein ORS3428_30570 [Mesorhizobium sp. ORS 3428]|nr:hypothetical protein ORS3428_30570 [Mesorhizobium sp. ORS 3428]
MHLKFPFSVVGGVLTFPTSERVKVSKKYPTGWRSTEHLIQRAVKRLVRAGGRQTEGDAPHLLEAIGVLVYDPDTAQIHPTMPEAETGLRWESFVQNLARAHEGRFEGQDDATRAAIAEAAIEAGETPDDPEPGETAT